MPNKCFPIKKWNKFSFMQCAMNEMERKQMKGIPFASIIRSLMYAQNCTKLDITFAVGILDRYQSNLGLDH